jgi:hypothetical protein
MKNIFKLLLISLATATLFGCAHPISLAPNLSDARLDATPTINKSVAYYVSDADRSKQVITPGGGGDKLSYFPFRDLETGIYKVLSSVFSNVSKLNSPPDPASVAKNNVVLIFRPEISTTSSSPSMFTWPPTKFSIELSCKVTNAQGEQVTTVRVLGEGAAEFDEFKKDFSLTSKRAADDVLQKFLKALTESADLKK